MLEKLWDTCTSIAQFQAIAYLFIQVRVYISDISSRLLCLCLINQLTTNWWWLLLYLLLLISLYNSSNIICTFQECWWSHFPSISENACQVSSF